MKVINELGNRYGRLMVIERAGYKRKAAAWLCRCDCGTEKVIVGSHLRCGRTKSCGCLRGRSPFPEGEASFNWLIRMMKDSAKKRGHIWKLSKDEVRTLTKSKCFYCGVEPRQIASTKVNTGDYIYNGIDRVDNTKGYTINNVVPCCGFCNYAKRTQTQEHFKAWVKSIYNHWASKDV